MKLVMREAAPRAAWVLEQAGVHPLLARLFAARGVAAHSELDDSLTQLLPPASLRGAPAAAQRLAQAIRAQQHICIVADYDCDGASACAVGLRGLRLLGAQHAHYLVPDRVVDGYGLTESIAERVHASGAQLLVTVDNGIASVAGVARARALGLDVIITDHHLPGPQLPQEAIIVNPNQPGCDFASKAIAGVGVMFYVLLALRAELRAQGVFSAATQPKLDSLLPLVALGTVADVVALDANNRRLVAQGLRRIRAQAMPVGMAALFRVAARSSHSASTFDLGFALGPRINAAGRLADMTVGIEALSTDDAGRADELARQLDSINRERRELEGQMRERAQALADELGHSAEPPAAICVSDPAFHEGVVGIVAARIKDRMHRPTFVFAPSGAPGRAHELRGSGRSIAGFHLRDALDLLAKREPGLLLRFGGHAMAAGCAIAAADLARFSQALTRIAAEQLDANTLTRRLATDGPLPPEYRRTDMAQTLAHEVWGQAFAPPLFAEELAVLSQRLVGEKHLALKLEHQGQTVDGIWFGHDQPLPARAKLAYRLEVDEWNGQARLRFVIEAGEWDEGKPTNASAN